MNAQAKQQSALLMPSPPSENALIMEPPMTPGSPEWLALRRTGIGGSDVAAAMGLSNWMTPYELWLDKRGQLPPREDNPAMEWGRLLEPMVRRKYMMVTGRSVDVPTTTFRSSRYPWMLANLDGVMPGRLYEGKTARTAEGWGEPGSADIPMVYIAQVQHYMHVMRAPVTDVAVLIGGSDFRIYEVPADRELQELMVDAEAAFWQRVVTMEPPPIETVEDARLRWGSLAIKGPVPASDTALAQLQTLRDATEHRKNLEGVEAECKAYLMGCMGEIGDAIVDARGKPLATWKLAAAPMRFDTDAFGIDHPDLLAQYTKPGKAVRKFLLKGNT